MTRYSPYRIAMSLCQAGIVLSFFWLGPNNEYWFEEGVLYAIMFTVTVVVLLDMPRGVFRWSVAGCYAVAFTAVFYGGWTVSSVTASPASIMEAVLMSFAGCTVVAVIVALVKWLAQLPDVARPPYWWPQSLGGPSGDEHLPGSHTERRSDRPGV